MPPPMTGMNNNYELEASAKEKKKNFRLELVAKTASNTVILKKVKIYVFFLQNYQSLKSLYEFQK